jgi:hypothetical protein
MTDEILTGLGLNRALLARQLLLERQNLAVPRALERIGGLQMQYALSGYIGLWSRLAGFRRGDLSRALERRTVVQGTLFRATIHAVSARDYPLLAEAIRHGRRDWWLRAHGGRADVRKVIAAARRTESLLANGPLRRRELDEKLGIDSVVWNGVGLWLDLVRVPPTGTWENRRADLYALADEWLGPANVTRDEGLDLLVRRYLAGFGPAPLQDVAIWAGLPVSTLAPAAERLRLRRFRDERGAELLDLRRAPLPDPETPAPIRFLPTWDAVLLVHARRTQILPERFRPLVFNTKTPHSVPTFLVDGRVAGTWRHDGDRIRIEPFGRLQKGVRSELAEEAERLRRLFLAEAPRSR